MKISLVYAALAGIAWGLGGYFEKAGLRELSLPPIAGITVRTAIALVLLAIISIPAWKAYTFTPNTAGWIMIVVGGGIVAGTLGMWSFYASLATAENLGAALAIAFALSPLTGTVIGLITRSQPFDWKTGLGLCAIIIGIVLINIGRERP